MYARTNKQRFTSQIAAHNRETMLVRHLQRKYDPDFKTLREVRQEKEKAEQKPKEKAAKKTEKKEEVCSTS